MTINDFSNYFDGVRWSGNSKFQARCPCHDDKQASLSVCIGDKGGIILNCFAGCDTQAILDKLGLSFSDISGDREKKPFQRKKVAAIYEYSNGTRKLRYEPKSFTWEHKSGSKWESGRGDAPHVLYRSGTPGDPVYLVEGEKDADNVGKNLGLYAVSPENGAGKGSKWLDQYTQELRGHNVVILPDNDDVGWEFMQHVADELLPVAQSVKMLDLSKVWRDIPEHGDISDLIDQFGSDTVKAMLKTLEAGTDYYTVSSDTSDSFSSLFLTLDQFEQKAAEWLVPGYIPKGQITTLASNGGVGKTSFWVDLAAAISSGNDSFLDEKSSGRKPGKVLFMSSEDSVRIVLKRRLVSSGADQRNIISPDFANDRDGFLQRVKFGSSELDQVISSIRPELCIFDPIQGFIPQGCQMGDRAAMRNCLAPLISLGEKYGTTFLVICHTNKRTTASGRDRIADSSDIWDISRSVLMMGKTGEDEVRYLSQEKSNYGPLMESVLFTVDGNGSLHREGTTWKRDEDFQAEKASQRQGKCDDCKDWIIHELEEKGGKVRIQSLDFAAERYGYSGATLKRAKAALAKEGKTRSFQVWENGNSSWYLQLTYFPSEI